ncbi:MAG: ribbon-helix-helix domain-containing protein [Lentisphaeria bacterium]|nr:ribbon-helix-helix domain-containing protein [Lentisphaeria bacterium]
MTTISLKIPADLDRRLQQTAARRHTSRSALMREAAELYLSTDETAESCLCKVSDLVGSVDGPEDLSSNKDHLRGFGQ